MKPKRETQVESVGEETMMWGSKLHNGIVPGKKGVLELIRSHKYYVSELQGWEKKLL